MKKKFTIQSICDVLEGTLEGPGHEQIVKITGIQNAAKGEISFVALPKFEKYLYNSLASAVIIPNELEIRNEVKCSLIRVKDVKESFNRLLKLFSGESVFETGISNLSFVASEADLGERTSIGNFCHISEQVEIGADSKIASQVYLGKGVKIGKNVLIYPGVKIYHDCEIGDDCIIHANAVIGSDGFGFNRKEDGTYEKIPQIGNVIVESGVEIGANTTIDRATFASTIIKKGVKLDNLIQVGHNVEIGDHTVIAAQSGLAGSVIMGKNCVVGGQCAFAPHLKIADGSQFQGKSGVLKSIEEPEGKYMGIPVIGYMNYIKSYAVFKRLPEMEKKLKSLQNELNELKKK